MKDRLDLWTGEFGDAYHDRNAPSRSNIKDRARWFREVLNHLPPFAPESILEVGCGSGANLAALESMCNALLRGVEPNARARRNAVRQAPFARIFDDAANRLTLSDREVDLAITCGVLIHIPDEGLPDAMAEIHRVAKRFILCAEYYGRKVEVVPYRGEEGALWRRPYLDLWMEQFPNLKPLAQGFAWKRTTGLDDLTWGLFEKPAYSNNTDRAW